MHQVRGVSLILMEHIGHGLTYITAFYYKKKIRTINKNPSIKEKAYIIHTETGQYGTGKALAALHVTRIDVSPLNLKSS